MGVVGMVLTDFSVCRSCESDTSIPFSPSATCIDSLSTAETGDFPLLCLPLLRLFFLLELRKLLLLLERALSPSSLRPSNHIILVIIQFLFAALSLMYCCTVRLALAQQRCFCFRCFRCLACGSLPPSSRCQGSKERGSLNCLRR